MRKLYFIAFALLASLPLAAQRVGTSPWGQPQLSPDVARYAQHHRQAAASQTEVIVDEDFAGLTAGTEDVPDTQPLLQNGDLTDPSLFKPYAESCTDTWGGHNLYQAGGCIAVVNGFLNTPTGDYSGNLRVSFRARLVKGQSVSDPTIDILLARRSKLIDFKRQQVKLTDEWQTFTFEASNGWWYDTMIQLYTSGSFSYLVDDFHIEHDHTSIEPPAVADAYDLTPTGFTAAWKASAYADSYLLSVYSKTTDPALEHINEGFEDLQSADGVTLDADQSGLPAGWTLYSSVSGSRQLYTDAGYHSANGAKSVCLANDGDYLLTPKCDVSLTSFSLWARVDDRGQDGVADGRLLISALTDDGWFEWAYLNLQDVRGKAGGTIDLTQGLSLFYNVYQVKLTLQKAAGDQCKVALDDVAYEAPGAAQRHYVLRDEPVSGAETDHYVVTGLDSDTDYYYRVKARNEQFTSEESNEMEVFDVHTPVALPATDVTEGGYTANWQCGAKADYFRLDQKLHLKMQADAPGYTMLEEDFSKVVSDYDETWPEEVELTTTYQPIDQYTHVGGWQASSYSIANGMIGGIDKRDGYLAGCIATPFIDLSHNDGQCSVTLRAYGYEGDFLVIQGSNPATYAGIYFSTTGFVEQTVNLPLCSSKERLYIYSNNYYPFLLDYIKITQDLKQGDEVTLINRSVSIDARDTRSLHVDVAEWPASAALQYTLTAFRNYHGESGNVWASPASNAITVKDAPTGLNRPYASSSDDALRVVSGGLSLTCAEPTAVRIYTATGTLVCDHTYQAGTSTLSLPAGTYVVHLNGRAVKVRIAAR